MSTSDTQKLGLTGSVGNALGVWIGTAGAIIFTALLLLNQMHGPYLEPVYAPVSYLFGTERARLEFYGTLAGVLFFLGIRHGTRHAQILFLWTAAGLVQLVFAGGFVISIHRLNLRRSIELLGPFMQHAIFLPVGIPIAVVAALLTRRWISRGLTVDPVESWRTATTEMLPSRPLEKDISVFWFPVAAVTGFLAVSAGAAVSLSLVATDYFDPWISNGGQEAGVLVLLISWFVFNMIATRSRRLLIGVGAVGVTVGIAELQYGYALAGIILPLGVLLVVCGSALALAPSSSDSKPADTGG